MIPFHENFPFQAFPLLMADIDPSGNMNANIIHAPTDRSRIKFMSQIKCCVHEKWNQKTRDVNPKSH